MPLLRPEFSGEVFEIDPTWRRCFATHGTEVIFGKFASKRLNHDIGDFDFRKSSFPEAHLDAAKALMGTFRGDRWLKLCEGPDVINS